MGKLYLKSGSVVQGVVLDGVEILCEKGAEVPPVVTGCYILNTLVGNGTPVKREAIPAIPDMTPEPKCKLFQHGWYPTPQTGVIECKGEGDCDSGFYLTGGNKC